VSDAIVNLQCWTDEDYAQAFRVQVNSDYYDFAGCALWMHVRHVASDHTVYLELKGDDAGLAAGESGLHIYSHPSDITGVKTMFDVVIARTELVRIPPDDYEQSLICIRPDGLYDAIWRGTFTNAIGPTR
jgi:hypothetical protein